MPRTQELTFSSLLLVQVSTCEGGRRLPPQKGTSKDSQGFGPYQNKPFRVPHNKKRGSSSQNSNHHFPQFPQVGGNRTSEAPGAVLDPTLGDEDVETPPPND